MAFNSPNLGGYTFQNPPDSMSIIPRVVQQVNELADGSFKQRILGYRYEASLTWDNNWIRSTDLTGIMAVANTVTASLTFIPRPTTFPTRSYVVLWTNKFEFGFYNGIHNLYNGSIELVTITPTATINDLP